MRRVKALRTLRIAALSRLSRAASTVRPTPPDLRQRKAAASYCLIEIVDLWGAFIRALYVSSALGATHGNGATVGSSRFFHTSVEALTFATDWKFRRSAAGRRRGAIAPPYDREREPAWHRANNIANIAGALNLTNQATILAGLTRAGRSLDDLIAVRNFFAHRNADTQFAAAASFYRYAITPKPSLEEALFVRVPGLSTTLLDLWLADVHDTIDQMAR
jgi:hypothetical protein